MPTPTPMACDFMMERAQPRRGDSGRCRYLSLQSHFREDHGLWRRHCDFAMRLAEFIDLELDVARLPFLLFLGACGAATLTAPAGAQQTVWPDEGPRTWAPRPTVAAITANDLRTRLYQFADDSMMGRRIGEPGNYKGTEYIAREFKRLGLKPAGDNGTYFQDLPLRAEGFDSASSRLIVAGARRSYRTDWVPDRADGDERHRRQGRSQRTCRRCSPAAGATRRSRSTPRCSEVRSRSSSPRRRRRVSDRRPRCGARSCAAIRCRTSSARRRRRGRSGARADSAAPGRRRSGARRRSRRAWPRTLARAARRRRRRLDHRTARFRPRATVATPRSSAGGDAARRPAACGTARRRGDLRRGRGEVVRQAGRPAHRRHSRQPVTAHWSYDWRMSQTPARNVIAILPGSDPARAGEYVLRRRAQRSRRRQRRRPSITTRCAR